VRILILGSDNFAEPLRRLGCRVLTCGPEGELRLAEPDPDWPQVEAAARRAGFAPQAVVVTDHVGRRLLPTGLADCPVVTVFYGVDSPLNRFWQTPYARLFDLALLDQPGEAEELAQSHPGAAWLPVGVDPAAYQVARPEAEVLEVCFVGVVDSKVRPKRSAVLERVARRAGLTVRGGRRERWFPTDQAAALYAKYAVTLNENLFPGFTTRPLEVMAAGGCLLGEAAPGAMDAFVDAEHLAFFGPDSLEQKLELLLSDAALRRRLRQAGQKEVRARHSLEQRAREMLVHIRDMQARPQDGRPRLAGGDALAAEGEALVMAGLRWPARGGGRRALRGAARLRAAAADGAEPLAANRAAGLALAALGRPGEAAAHLARAAELGGPAERLAWLLAGGAARPAELGLAGRPGEARFHLAAAELLRSIGCGASIGFNRTALHPCLWTPLEHLLEATRLAPGEPSAWERLGGLLLASGAPNQAHGCLAKAVELGAGPEAARAMEEAAREGYL
jgi:tetratricopeptide (TPR) repeat protein